MDAPPDKPNKPIAVEDAPDEQPGQVFAQLQHWNGPLPPPATLAQFEDIVPGSAARIIASAEREQLHRHATERVAISASIADSKLGKWFGLLISAAALAGAVLVAFKGGPWQVSVALVGLPIAGIVKEFIRGRKDGDD